MKMHTTIHVPFRFDAVHSLEVRPEPHAHTYEVTLSIEGRVDKATGFVADMGEVSKRFQPVVSELHGTNLNGNAALRAGTPSAQAVADAPTCERMALYFAEKAVPLVAQCAPGVRLKAVHVKLLEGEADGTGTKEWGHATVEMEW
jgi:6-pyruvoyl-tetrahydropterin synthase